MKKTKSAPTFSFTEINDLNLEQEWKCHCDAVEKYAKKKVRASKRHADAKAALKVTEAEVELDIRQNGHGTIKITDNAIKALVVLDRRTRVAVRLVNETKYAVDMYEAAMETLEHRKKSLSDRISLWMADYFKEPSVRGPARKRMEEENKDHRRRRE